MLDEASAANERLGHENLGFLSEAFGFMPREAPLSSVPESHRVWDEVAARLPARLRDLTLRPTLEHMAVLGAADAELPDRYLLRAATILGVFAQSYHYAETAPPEELPASVLEPWRQVSRRLGRPAPNLSFIDLNMYNYTLIDPHDPDPMRVENLQMLVRIAGNEDERRFQMTPVEVVAQSAPTVAAVVRAQEAVVGDDRGGLERELLLITDVIHRLTDKSFPKVNPNRYSDFHVDPVVWGKTVAPFATPYDERVPGPSGTAIPSFQLLDAFFGRTSYASNVGHETARARGWFPPHWQRFLAAAEAISVPDYVERHGSRLLRGLFVEALESYVGESGLLGRHRMKTYGFLDLSFKAGRTRTLGGMGGGFGDRLWDRTDAELERSRRERYRAHPNAWHHAAVKEVRTLTDDGTTWVGQVVLDVAGTGLRFQPGNRCAILPENGDDLVERTLRSLRARGDEPIELDALWREAIGWRAGYAGARVVPLRTLLRFGRIRPLDRGVAKLLHRVTSDEALHEIVEQRAEDQWELWDVLALLVERGFDPKGLWKAQAGEAERITKVVSPEIFRTYSISAAAEAGGGDGTEEIELTLSRLRYQTVASEVSVAATRQGTGSGFLARSAERGAERVSVRIVRPPRFSLPADPRRPVVMFAGGTGLAPFRSMLLARARQPLAGENWLFFATRTRADLYHYEELRRLVADGNLHLRVTFSRDDVRLRTVDDGGGPRLLLEPGPRQHIGDEMLGEENARALWRLLRDEADGGAGASFYVCGRAGFATAVMEGIKTVLARFAEPAADGHSDAGTPTIPRLVAQNRYLQEIYTTYTGRQGGKRAIDASVVADYNNDDNGYWIIVRGRVYDVTEFVHLHPGGQKIIRSYAGLDATRAYEMVRHDVNPEVDSMLAMHEIGAARRLDFGSAWTVAVSDGALRLVTLKDLYRRWITALHATVEMENALANDYAIRSEPVTFDEGANAICQSPYKTQLLLQAHNRFLRDYLAELTGPTLEQLWAATSSLDGRHRHVRWASERVAAIRRTHAALAGLDLGERVTAWLQDAARGEATDADRAQAESVTVCQQIEAADRQFMREMKRGLQEGVRVFERWERETVTKGRDELLAAVGDLPLVLERHVESMATIAAGAAVTGGGRR